MAGLIGTAIFLIGLAGLIIIIIYHLGTRGHGGADGAPGRAAVAAVEVREEQEEAREKSAGEQLVECGAKLEEIYKGLERLDLGEIQQQRLENEFSQRLDNAANQLSVQVNNKNLRGVKAAKEAIDELFKTERVAIAKDRKILVRAYTLTKKADELIGSMSAEDIPPEVEVGEIKNELRKIDRYNQRLTMYEVRVGAAEQRYLTTIEKEVNDVLKAAVNSKWSDATKYMRKVMDKIKEKKTAAAREMRIGAGTIRTAGMGQTITHRLTTGRQEIPHTHPTARDINKSNAAASQAIQQVKESGADLAKTGNISQRDIDILCNQSIPRLKKNIGVLRAQLARKDLLPETRTIYTARLKVVEEAFIKAQTIKNK